MALHFDRSEPGVWLSAGLHVAILIAGVLSFSSTKLPDADEGIPVEVITDNQFSEITKGELSATKPQPDPKPRVDRQAETHQERDPGEAKTDAPAPPKRPADMAVADEQVEAPAAASAPPPPPPQRLAQVQPEAAAAPPPPAPPARPDTSKADAARAEAAKAEAAKAEAAEKAEEQKLEAEAIERAKVEAQKKAEVKAQAEAKAKADAEAKAKAVAKAKAEAEAKAIAEAKAQAEMKALADAAAKDAADAKAKAEAEHHKKIADAKAKAQADARAKALADARAKADAEAKARKQAELADKFSAGDIRQLLASKEPSQSTGATGREVNKTASLGTATGSSQRLNPSQRDQLMGLLRDQLHRCWQAPMAAQSADKPPVPSVRVRLNQDGSLAGDPSVMNPSSDPLFRSIADSATRATRRCAPLKIPAQFAPFYQDWRDLVVNFDPREMG
jgi:colicin import membrane protein